MAVFLNIVIRGLGSVSFSASLSISVSSFSLARAILFRANSLHKLSHSHIMYIFAVLTSSWSRPRLTPRSWLSAWWVTPR